ncbi:GH25 family lysozyme [Bacillus mycoides]|uniref:GH25 family lysozyme n=1 Tax=Bacillus mycoides TaxID=1405 RepID=UPI003D6629E1
MGYIVDISKWNDKINWPVAAPQIELAICRVQYGSKLVDHLYNEHVTKLEQYGIPHAAYAYGCFVSVADAIVEAKDFLVRVNPNSKFLVLDVEDDTVKSMDSKGNLGDLAKASQAFIDTCKAAGWKVGFYVAHHMYGDYNLQSVQADFVWLPRYGTNDGNPQKKPSYPCDIWQYTDNGYIDGIGRVDINLLEGNKDLNWYAGVPNKSYRINIGDFNELTWAGDTKREVKNLFPDYGLWDGKIGEGHRLYLGDFNSKEWVDQTFSTLKEHFSNYEMWIDEVK